MTNRWPLVPHDPLFLMLIASWFDEITTCHVTFQGGLIPPVHLYRWALMLDVRENVTCWLQSSSESVPDVGLETVLFEIEHDHATGWYEDRHLPVNHPLEPGHLVVVGHSFVIIDADFLIQRVCMVPCHFEQGSLECTGENGVKRETNYDARLFKTL